MSPYRFGKQLVMILLSCLVISGCQLSKKFVVTPVPTLPSVIISDPSTNVATTALTGTPTPTATVMPDLAPANNLSEPTTPVDLASKLTATPVTTTVPAVASRDLGLFVFDQQKERMGRMSFDGLQFQHLKQVPKLDSLSLEYGLLTEHAGYFVSPDGNWLTTIVGFDQIILVDTVRDQYRTVAQIGAGAWLSWSPDSQSFAFREGERTVCVYRLVEQLASCFNEFEGKIVAAAWSPDGSKLALSVAGELAQDTPGVVNGTVWVIEMANQRTEFVTNQDIPLGSVSANDLLVWTTEGLIVNRLHNRAIAALFMENIEILLASNAIGASPTGNYVVYEDGNVEQVKDNNFLVQLPVCTSVERQTMFLTWAYDEKSLAYTLFCAEATSVHFGIVRLDNHNLTWSLAISNNLRLIGWSHDNNYVFFRRETGDPRTEYTIERVAATPGSAFETLADLTYLIGILGSDVEKP